MGSDAHEYHAGTWERLLDGVEALADHMHQGLKKKLRNRFLHSTFTHIFNCLCVHITNTFGTYFRYLMQKVYVFISGNS